MEGKYRFAWLLLALVNVPWITARQRLKGKKYKKLSSFLKPFVQHKSATNSSEENNISRCIAVDVAVSSNSTQKVIQRALHSAGFTASACYANVCSGCIPQNQIQALSELPEVLFIHPVLTQLSSGSVQTQGDAAMKTDLVRQNLGVDGTGLKIGVLSDTFDCLGQHDPNTDSYADDIASGDLPSNVQVLKDYTYDEFLQLNQFQARPCSDEGRAMLQLIYDVAPGAQLAFYSGWAGKAAMAIGINSLAAAGCDIIVDDLSFSDAAFFQDDLPALAVDNVVSQGVAYFSAAGNFARQSWEGAFVSSGQTGTGGGELHNFGNGVTYQELNIDTQALFIFQWDQPFGTACNLPFCPGSKSDLDLYATNPDTGQVVSSTDNNIDSDPLEIISLPTGRWRIQIELMTGSPPGLMKWMFWGRFGLNPSGVDKSTVFGHANAASAAAVGSAFWGNTPVYGTDPATVEPQSALGGTSILFDTNGNRLASPEVRMQPRFVGPDGTSTTFFGTFANDKYYFYGTSAAAPHVAAGAALLLGINPNLEPQNLYSIIERTALDMDNPYTSSFDTGFDYRTGYGFVNFQTAAEQAVGSPTQSPTASPNAVSNSPTSAATTASPIPGGGSTSSPSSRTASPTQFVPPTSGNVPTITPTAKNGGPTSSPSSSGPITSSSPTATMAPSPVLTSSPSAQMAGPTFSPTLGPVSTPTVNHTAEPTVEPTNGPTEAPTTTAPLSTQAPTSSFAPTFEPTSFFPPTLEPTSAPFEAVAPKCGNGRRGCSKKGGKKAKKSKKKKANKNGRGRGGGGGGKGKKSQTGKTDKKAKSSISSGIDKNPLSNSPSSHS